MTERQEKEAQPKYWVIEVSETGSVSALEEMEEGKLLQSEYFASKFPKEPGVYQWRPVGSCGMATDCLSGSIEELEYGWGEGVLPREEWMKPRTYSPFEK